MSVENLLQKASKAYYEGTPIMSDVQFDMLAKYYSWDSVGYGMDEKRDKYPHLDKLYSLQNVFTGDNPPNLPNPVVTSPKLDGAAISILYYKGKLQKALTRGDGVQGVDITEKVKYLVPNTIKQQDFMVQIVGEVVAPKEIKNSRNYVAGALNLKNLDEFNTRDLTFIAYSMSPEASLLWSSDMEYIRNLGFNTVLDSNWDQFPQDGVVFRTDKYKDFFELGYTSHHPRGAYALKEKKDGKATTLLDVVWQVGKSGIVSPVAILDPVDIGGALVSKATLHNISYIEDLDLELGCIVEVIRSGEVIPRVVKRLA